jgi:hypothetical protein
MIAPEDDPADTVKPRLEEIGADMARVRMLSTVPAISEEGRMFYRPLTIPRDVWIIEAAVERDGVGLLVIDPITACLDAGVKTHVDAEVRAALTPLVLMAQRTGVAVLMVRHFNKGGGEKAIYRGGGSIAFVGVCRIAYVLAEHPDNGDKRVLAQAKINIARTAPSLSFSLQYPPVSDPEAVPHIVWDDGVCDYDANALLSARRSEERKEIIRELRDADGPMSPTEVATALGIPEKVDAIRQRLSRMRKSGEMISPEYGKYALPVTPENPVMSVTLSQYDPMAGAPECDSVTGVTGITGVTEVSHSRECLKHPGELMALKADGSGYELCPRCRAEDAA